MRLLLLSWIFLCSFQAFSTEHQIHFANSDHELHVYHIKGKKPGKTMLIIGGMHNEPGGYVTADLFADIQLKQGNLIVVPRANMPAIVKNKRGINGDMNRDFSNDDSATHTHQYEKDVVAVLKELIGKSDVLLNLHDGYGYYRPTYESELKNPKRWGQAIITDRETFKSTDAERELLLGERAKRVVEKVNEIVDNPLHRFHYKNTNTEATNSQHKEQRTSATFFALYNHGVESYGVETSKNIRSLEQKVAYQTAIVNAFLDEFDIIPEPHKKKLEPPKLDYLLLSVNNQRPVAFKSGEVISLRKGDRLTIEQAITNYPRGVVADIGAIGQLNDMGKTFEIDTPTSIRVLKDQYLCGTVFIDVDSAPAVAENSLTTSSIAMKKTTPAHLLIKVNETHQKVLLGETIYLDRADSLVLVDYFNSNQQAEDVKLNFVGFVGNKKTNDGQDKGYVIDPKTLIKRFSVNGDGNLYQVKAEKNNQLIAQFYVSAKG